MFGGKHPLDKRLHHSPIFERMEFDNDLAIYASRKHAQFGSSSS